jgi:hypothetical protein
MHFFASSTTDFLKQNYSGFALLAPGSLLAVAAVLLLVRPRSARLLRWEVWCMPIAALVLFAAAHALLFRLYLPHRYTYPLLPFFCIAIGVVLRPTVEAWATRTRLLLAAGAVLPFAVALLGLTLFPLGPELSLSRFGSWLEDARWHLAAGLAVGLVLAAAWARREERSTGAAAAAVALVAAAVLVAEVTAAGGGRSPGATACRQDGLYRHLLALPKDTIVAGEARDMNCIPIAARRAVVISRKLYQPWDPEYFELIRERMLLTVDASFGASAASIVALRTLYGADYFLVRTRADARSWRGMAPFTREVRRLLRAGDVRAALLLPPRCRTWRGPSSALYSLACVASERSR